LLPVMLLWVQQVPIRSAGFYTNPTAGSLLHPNRLTKKHVLIKRHIITHDIIRCPANFIAQCFDGNNTVSLGFFLLIKSLCPITMPDHKVCCFYICPGQIFIAVLAVVLIFFRRQKLQFIQTAGEKKAYEISNF